MLRVLSLECVRSVAVEFDMKSCLLVEDNKVVRNITIKILSDLGMHVRSFENVPEAVASCEDMCPDLVLLDWDLPSLAALDFLYGINKLDVSQRPEILLLATDNDQEQFSLARTVGARHYLIKPFDKIIIRNKLQEIGLITEPVKTVA